MRTGVIVGSALAGAAVGAILTLSGREKNQVTNYFSGLKGNMSDYLSQASDKVSEWKGMLPGMKHESNQVPVERSGKKLSNRSRA